MKSHTHTLLTGSEQYLWNYIQQHLQNIPHMSIIHLSEAANVSTATIVRTMKKMGYEGYTDFRLSLKAKAPSSQEFSGLVLADSFIKKAIYKNQQEALLTLNNINSTVVEDAIQKIKVAKRIILYSRGLSEMIAQEMCLKFLLLDKYCESYTDPNIIMKRTQKLTKEDVIIFISLQGETKELVTACKTCLQKEISTITLTTNAKSQLANLSDICFIGFKTTESFFPEYEIQSRLPLSILSRILLDAYAIRIKNQI